MMTDIYGKEHHTVGDYTCHPEWVAYGEKVKVWLKSLTVDDWMMIRAKEIVDKNTKKGQLVLPLFPKLNPPDRPTVPVSILK